MIIKLAMIIVFFAITVLVGFLAARSAKGVDGFVLGGRSVGPWLTAFSFGTSYFSAVIFIGYAGRFGWNFGLASTWVGLGNALIGSLMAWMLLGRRTRVMTQHLGSRTMPDFFGLRYESKALRLVAAAIVFIFLIPYTASLFNGLAQLFSASFALPYWGWVIIMAVLTGVYVIVGGYLGSAINNFIQGIIMLVGIVAVIFAVLNNNGGLMESIAKLSEIPAATSEGTTFHGALTSFFGPHPLQLLGVVILTSLGTWGLPQMVGKFYAIKDESAITKGTVISTVFAVIVAGGCYFLGGFGRLYGADVLGLNAEDFATLEELLEAIATRSPQSTSPKNCWIAAAFIGPLQTTGLSVSFKSSAIDTAFKEPVTLIGIILFPIACSLRSSMPSIFAMDGPWISRSIKPVWYPWFARAYARLTETVLFPTPPFPERTKITWRTLMSAFCGFWQESVLEVHPSQFPSHPSGLSLIFFKSPVL